MTAWVAPNLEQIRQAANVLSGVAYRTPLLPALELGHQVGAELFLKCENLQKTGSFKIRGAYNRIRSLTARQRQRGIVAASAGNHAQGVAFASREIGVPSTIVMPASAPMVKVEATRAYGAEVALHGRDFNQAYRYMDAIRLERGATLVHPFNDPLVIAGQATVGLEIIEEIPDLDLVVVPVGGGGLATGVAIAVKALSPKTRVVGVQAAAAPALYRSWLAGRLVTVPPVVTLADGLAVKEPKEDTFRALQAHLDDFVLVEEEEIARAILLLLENAHMLVEGAAATTLAALLSRKVQGKKVALVLSGGNIDGNVLARIIERGMVSDGRYLRLSTRLLDRPGELQGLLNVVADLGANVIRLQHDRLYGDVALGETEVKLLLQTENHEHIERILAAIRVAGFACQEIK